ncbi:MAG: orotidine-5'-phosphate decarboxylase [Anaerolineae bacterium]|nr:orotidine-5'-phosphate decarboxylase [Anaerolineae bacterium]
MRFTERLEERAAANDSLLCVGLDPRPERFPPDVAGEDDPIYAANRRVIDATRHLVCAYKPNYAFYEAQGIAGLRALARTIAYIGAETPVILDAKRGDIGSTAAAYARAAYEVWGAGAVTVAPYLGYDAIAPFIAYPDRGVFVLCHTSNPSAGELQTVRLGEHGDGAEPLYLRVARLAQGWGDARQIGLVVGATYPDALRAVRAIAPESWFLVPGIGAQGGDLAGAIAAGLRADGMGMVVSVSRGVCDAEDPGAAASQLREQVNAARAAHSPGQMSATRAAGAQAELIRNLARIGAVRFGTFTLKSGADSPVYIDLRLLASHPQVLARAAAAYAAVLDRLDYDRIAAIPYAALPIGTAVALQTGRPLIYPRKEAKEYGTRRAIEGAYRAGERAVVLDDLITTGGSKVEAIAPLAAAGLAVQDIVVLIDREGGGREELARQGYRLHAVLTLRQILDVLAAGGEIESAQRDAVLDWLAGA